MVFLQDAREDVDLTADAALAEVASEAGATQFTGYTELLQAARIVRLVQDGAMVESCGVGAFVEVVLDTTPFYAESGGQVGDVGTLTVRIFSLTLVMVTGTQLAAPESVLCFQTTL